MKVIGMVGSPRSQGNTARLVEEVLAGAKDAGNETHIFYLGEMEIKPLEYGEEGYVYPEDDFTSLMPHLETMDGIVIGTPIYYDQVSSRTKLFIDRLYYYSMSHGAEYRKRFPDGVKCVNVITCGWDHPNAYDEVLEWMNGRMKNYWKMKVIGDLKCYGSHKRPIRDNKSLLAEARELGKMF